MSDKRNYNYLALRGSDVDDMEYVDQYGLDPKVAYTPRINDAMLDVVYKKNVDMFTKSGDSEVEARSKADKMRHEARRNIKQLLKDNK